MLATRKSTRTPAVPLRISGVDTSGAGNIVVYAAEGLTANDLLPHADAIAHMILPSPSDFIKASLDEALRKPQHGAAKTGGRLRQTKSRAVLGGKDGTPATGSKVTAKSRKAAAASAAPPDAPAPAASQDAAANAPISSQTA